MTLIIVFRPVQLSKSGFLYGWNVSDDTICIAGALTSSSREQAAALFGQALSERTTTLEGKDEIQPEILGFVDERRGIVLDHTLPPNGSWFFVEYSPPNTKRMQFLSLEPLNLDMTQQSSSISSTILSDRARLLHQSSVSRRPPKKPYSSLQVSLRYLNKVHELRHLIAARQNNTRLSFWIRSGFAPNVNRRIEQIFNLVPIFFHTPKKISPTFHSLLFPFDFLWDNLSNNNISAFVQQIDVRKDLVVFVLKRIWTNERHDKNDLHFISVHYISLYNSVWLILNDIIVGSAFGLFLIENSEVLSLMLHKAVRKVFVTYMENILVWLDNWPAGLKLNTELSRALFHCFIRTVYLFEVVLDYMVPYLATLLWFTGVMGRFGATMSLALLSDYLSILTGHLYMLHLVTALMFSQLKSFSGSLWNLFRGKRFNVLRQRNDFWEYDLDQLLLGTILITLITFLFPTVAIYYMLFALSRFGTMILHAGLDTCLAFMNHFPLFALMLRIKEPFRLPGGIQFTTGTAHDSLVIQNQPISLSKLFFQHLAVWSKLASHYHPLRLLACIVKGVPMTQLERQNIRYDLVHKKANMPAKPQ